MAARHERRLSVIVPVYNTQNTLRHCIESILNQTYREFEVVLVDDGSADDSGILCDEYAKKDSRVKVIHTENFGPFQARRLGAEKAMGEILTFSDADDWMEANAFETAMGLFDQYDPDILAYTYDCGDGKAEKYLYAEGLYRGEEVRGRLVPGMMYDSAFGKRRLNPSLCCKLIKRELFTKVTESVKDRIVLGDDALVTYPAVCLAESVFICNRVFYHYCVHESSVTRSCPLERITEVKAFQEHMTRLIGEMGMLDQLDYQIENYVRSFLAMMIRGWYGIELTPVLFAFPYHLIPRGAKVLIYGAGNVGKSYVNELKLTGYAEIVGWADKKYGSIKKYHDVDVTAPEQIKGKEFDVLLIAVLDEEVSEEVRRDLVGAGIPENKIVWSKPLCVI